MVAILPMIGQAHCGNFLERLAADMEFGEIITIVSIGVTIFVVWKLYTVLGQRTGHEGPPPANMTNRAEQDDKQRGRAGDNVIDLPGVVGKKAADARNQAAVEAMLKPHAEPGSDLAAALKLVVEKDHSFVPDDFLNGAKMAYEMIVTAFNDGDTKALKNLLAKEVFDGFSTAIADRKAKGEHMNFSFVGINSAKIVDAEVVKSDIFISVRFNSQIISARLNEEGEVIDGDMDEIADVTDIWTFSRDATSRDPNWKLVATEAIQ